MSEPISIYDKIFYAIAIAIVWLSKEMWVYIKSLKREDKPLQYTNGTKEFLLAKMETLRTEMLSQKELLQNSLEEQERRIERHKEDWIKEMDIMIRRVDNISKKVSKNS